MQPDRKRTYDLFLLNLALQLFDGVATYEGMQLGWKEANPLLEFAFTQLGVGTSLLLFKAKACGLLLILNRIGSQLVVVPVLTFLAAAYVLLSFFPWLTVFLMHIT
ncbi:MAG: hypothetical protein HY695_11085 [Deltaproteobacteria bacterium]|nr:hypothetical protein [Deltaproteobacteria bacterium]